MNLFVHKQSGYKYLFIQPILLIAEKKDSMSKFSTPIKSIHCSHVLQVEGSNAAEIGISETWARIYQGTIETVQNRWGKIRSVYNPYPQSGPRSTSHIVDSCNGSFRMCDRARAKPSFPPEPTEDPDWMVGHKTGAKAGTGILLNICLGSVPTQKQT